MLILPDGILCSQLIRLLRVKLVILHVASHCFSFRLDVNIWDPKG